MICLGHRGARGHEPENTLRSVGRAIELGADWIEVDVHLVEDELVVIHDEHLERTTNGSGRVSERGHAYLRSLDAGDGERIPTLDEVFDRVDGRVGINVEVKAIGGAPAADRVARLVRERVASGWSPAQILVSSFDHRLLDRVRRADDFIQVGALFVGLPVENAAFAEALGAFSVHPAREVLDRAFVVDAHRRGLKVFPFVVNDVDDIAAMRDLGVDGVFTDYPERVRSADTPRPAP